MDKSLCLTLVYMWDFSTLRQKGQDTVDELRSKDFRKDLEERERQAARERTKEKGSRSTAEQNKIPNDEG